MFLAQEGPPPELRTLGAYISLDHGNTLVENGEGAGPSTAYPPSATGMELAQEAEKSVVRCLAYCPLQSASRSACFIMKRKIYFVFLLWVP